MRNNDRDELDGLLEDALRSYAPKPRAGIEARILRRVRADGVRDKRVFWLAFAIPVPVLLLLVLLVRSPQPAPTKLPGPTVAHYVPAAAAPVPVATARRQLTKRGPRALPRSDQFPTPSPLTPEEQALVQFVSLHPAETRDIAAKANEPEPAPIEIPQLQITPLSQSGGL